LTLKFLADLVGGAWIGKVGFEGQTMHAVSSGQALRSAMPQRSGRRAPGSGRARQVLPQRLPLALWTPR
jgi:hypothetical protein